MKRVGFIGWRGMVGSVLLDRIRQDSGFTGFEPVFFTTSQVGLPGPDVGVAGQPLLDAFDIDILGEDKTTHNLEAHIGVTLFF